MSSTSFARSLLPLALAVLGSSVLSAGPALDPPRYEVIDLGVLDPNTPEALPTSLNSAGHVVGSATVIVPTGFGETRAFLYTTDTGMQEIVPLSLRNYAYGINSRGDVVGSRSPEGFIGPLQAFLYTASEGVVSGLTGLLEPSEGLAVNDGGQIVGYVGEDPHAPGARAFLWSDTGVIDIHDQLPAEAQGSVAAAINVAGAVVGWYELPYSTGVSSYRAFVRDASGGVRGLASPDGWGTQAVAVNAAGQIAGTATAAYPRSRAMLWEADGTFKDLGDLGTGTRSWAWGLNARGVVVGEAWTGGWACGSSCLPIYHAFVHRGGTMEDLNDLIPPGYELRAARAINDKGQIVAHGDGPLGYRRAFLLTPVLEPAQAIANLIATVEGFQLPKGIANGFVVKLEHAQAALEAGDTATACSQLQAFINHAQAQSGKALTVEQAEQIISEAQVVRAALGCS